MLFNLGQNWNNFWTVLICFNNNFNWKWQILNLIHWERLKLVPDLLLNFQVTLDRLILFLMQICLLEFVTFIDLSELAEPCSLSWQLENFKELSKMYLGQILLRRSLPHHLTNPLLKLQILASYNNLRIGQDSEFAKFWPRVLTM